MIELDLKRQEPLYNRCQLFTQSDARRTGCPL